MANLSYTAAQIDERLGKVDDIGDLDDLQTTDKDSVVDAINELFTSVSDGKSAIAAAITDKGVPTAATDSFADMADNIADIQTSPTLQTKSKTYTPTESAQSETVAADNGYDGLAGVNVTVNAVSSTYVGSGVTKKAATTYHPSTSDQTIAASQYLNGAQTIKAVTHNLSAGDIKSGVTLKIGDSSDDDCVASVTGTYTASGKNVQIAAGVNRATTNTLAAVSGQSITVAKSGKYDVYWGGYRSSTSGTSGSQLYIGNTAYGTENTTFSNHGQSVHLSNVSLNQGDVIRVYARSRGSNYYMYVSNLTIIEA